MALHFDGIRDAVRATVAWFAVFDEPVTAEQCQRYLIGHEATIEEVKNQLDYDPYFEHTLGLYHLAGSAGQAARRRERHTRAVELWHRTEEYGGIFRATPFLTFVGVGNSLAMGWPEASSDIDLFVVARADRLFTARFFLTLLTSIKGVRRHGDHIAGRFCLSFYAADTALDFTHLQIQPADPYLALWLATLTPVWGHTPELWQHNRWIHAYFPNLPEISYEPTDLRRSNGRKRWERLLDGHVGDAIERGLRWWQLRRARAKKHHHAEPTAVIIRRDLLKFHESDRRREFFDRWEELMHTA